MTEIDFGKLVSCVLARMDYTESDLSGDERRDADKARQHYKQALVEEIRRVFDEAEVPVPPAPDVPPCPRCGADVEGAGRFCVMCGLPLTMDAIPKWLIDVLAKDAGAAADDPRVTLAIVKFREEDPTGWSRLMQKIEKQLDAKA